MQKPPRSVAAFFSLGASNIHSFISLILFIGLLTVPFLAYRHSAPLPSFYNEWLAAVGILGMSTVWLKPTDFRLEIPLPTLLLAAFAGLLALQLALGMILYPVQGHLAVLYLLSAAILTVSTRSLSLSYGRTAIAGMLAWAILASGMLSGFAAMIQHWGIHTWFDAVIAQQADTRAYGNLAQANQFGNLEMLAAVALIYLAATRRIPLGLALPMGIVLAFGMVLSASRTMWLYLAAIPLLSILVHGRLRTDSSRRLVYGAFLLGALFVLIQQGVGTFSPASTASNHVAERLATIQGSSLQVHIGFMREAWQIFLDAPLLGAGYQQFAWQHFIQQAKSPNPIFFAYENIYASYAHNLIFQILAEFGLAGLAILVGLAIWLIAAFRKNVSPEQWLIYAMLIVILIHSMLEYPLYYLYFLAPFAILLTLASDRSVTTINPRLATLAAPLIMALGAAVLWATYSSYRHLEQAYGGTSQQIVLDAAARDHLMHASAGGIFDPEIDHLLNIMPVGLRSPEERLMQLQISDRSMRHRPTASRVYRHVFLLAINGNLTQAGHYLSMATRAYPGSLNEFEGQIERMRARHPEEKALQALSAMIDAENRRNRPAP